MSMMQVFMFRYVCVVVIFEVTTHINDVGKQLDQVYFRVHFNILSVA